jgi:hypothetical protein
MRSYLLAAAMAALCITSADAAVRITSDNGGLIGDYVNRYVQVRESGEQVVIDGMCLSACTMVVGILPPNRVCATPNAVLGFHAAWKPDGAGHKVTSGPATQALLSVYPAGIRRWIARHGGLTPRMMFLQGRELAALVPPCAGSTVAAARTPRGQTASRQVLRSALRRANIDARQGQ